ncbi:hypothetical protein KKA69_05970 [Patescibacteria group bacterium]|nr:hypothetical protein [Patescibacteria group bacterium]
MSSKITLELPEELLVEALRRLSSKKRRELINKVEGGTQIQAQGMPAMELDKLTGLISVGGDALEDSERLYDDTGCA